MDISINKIFGDAKSVEFGGKIINHMASNPKIMKYSCKVVTGADYAQKYEPYTLKKDYSTDMEKRFGKQIL